MGALTQSKWLAEVERLRSGNETFDRLVELDKQFHDIRKNEGEATAGKWMAGRVAEARKRRERVEAELAARKKHMVAAKRLALKAN